MNSEKRTHSIESQQEWLKTRQGESCLIRVSAEETNGLFSVVEILSLPGDGTSLHVHANEDEYVLVLEGTARIAYGDQVFDAQCGESYFLKRGIPHAWGNRTDSPLRLLMTCTPGGVEAVLPLIASQDMDKILSMAASFAVKPLGPAPF